MGSECGKIDQASTDLGLPNDESSDTVEGNDLSDLVVEELSQTSSTL